MSESRLSWYKGVTWRVCVCVCVMPDMLSNPSRTAVYQFSTWTLIIYRSVVLGGLKLSSLCLCVWVCVCMNPIGPWDLFSPTLQKNIGHRTPKIKLHYIKETLDAVVKEGTAWSIYMSKTGECSHNQLCWWSSLTVLGFHSCPLLFIFLIFISFVLWVNIACSLSLLKLHCWVEGIRGYKLFVTATCEAALTSQFPSEDETSCLMSRSLCDCQQALYSCFCKITQQLSENMCSI